MTKKTSDQVHAFKGFNKDLKCRDFQYKVGETYKHTGAVVRCTEGGFHSCEMPLDVWTYYGPATSRFALVTAAGKIDRAVNEDSKIASAEITIRAEIGVPDIVREAVAWIVALCKGAANTATDDATHAAAQGYSGHAAAQGSRGHAAAQGESGHAAAQGESGHAAAQGYSGHAEVHGVNSIAAAFGWYGTASADDGGWIVLAGYDDRGNITSVRSAKVGGAEGVKAGVAYRLSTAGEFVEVSR